MKSIVVILSILSLAGIVSADLVQIGGLDNGNPYYVWDAPSGTPFPVTLNGVSVTNSEGQVGTFDVIMSTTAADAVTVYHASRRISINSSDGSLNPIESTEPLYMTITNVSANISGIDVSEVRTFYLDSESESISLYDGDSNSQTFVGGGTQFYSVNSTLQPVDLSGETYLFETTTGSSWMLEHVTFDVTVVPEPATMGLCLFAAGGLLCLRRFVNG